jgi:hypothetical protein
MGNASGSPTQSSGCSASMRSGRRSRSFAWGPSVHDAMNDEMQVGARVDVVRDARRDDGQDIAGALSPFIEPSEEPIATIQN